MTHLKSAPSFLLLVLLLTVGPTCADDRDRFYDPNRVLDIQVELPERDWDELCGQTRSTVASFSIPPPESPFHYFKARLSIDGKKMDSVGIRKKGFLGSLDSRTPSLKLNLDKFVKGTKYGKVDNITLNNCKQDAGFLSQLLTYRCYRKAGLPAPRVNFAKVTVNGKYLGVYANIEPVKGPFLRRHFGKKIGTLYEGTLADFSTQSVDRFQRKNRNRDDDKREEIRKLAKILATKPLDVSALEQTIDLNQFMKFWAMESLVEFWDGYCNNQNNFFVYVNPTDKKLHFIPWGADVSFTKGFLNVLFKRGMTQSVHGRALLPSVLYQNEEMRKKYFVALRKLLDTVWNEEDLTAETKRVEKLLSEHLSQRQKRRFSGAVADVRAFIKSRRKEISDELAKGEPKLALATGPPMAEVVGEISARFQVKWSKLPADRPVEIPLESMTIQMKGAEPMHLESLSLLIGARARGGNAGPGVDPGSPRLVFEGRRGKGKIRVRLELTVSGKSFRAKNRFPVQIQGTLVERKRSLFFASPVSRPACGTVQFDAASTVPGEPVRGSLKLKLYKFDW